MQFVTLLSHVSLALTVLSPMVRGYPIGMVIPPRTLCRVLEPSHGTRSQPTETNPYRIRAEIAVADRNRQTIYLSLEEANRHPYKGLALVVRRKGGVTPENLGVFQPTDQTNFIRQCSDRAMVHMSDVSKGDTVFIWKKPVGTDLTSYEIVLTIVQSVTKYWSNQRYEMNLTAAVGPPTITTPSPTLAFPAGGNLPVPSLTVEAPAQELLPEDRRGGGALTTPSGNQLESVTSPSAPMDPLFVATSAPPQVATTEQLTMASQQWVSATDGLWTTTPIPSDPPVTMVDHRTSLSQWTTAEPPTTEAATTSQEPMVPTEPPVTTPLHQTTRMPLATTLPSQSITTDNPFVTTLPYAGTTGELTMDVTQPVVSTPQEVIGTSMDPWTTAPVGTSTLPSSATVQELLTTTPSPASFTQTTLSVTRPAILTTMQEQPPAQPSTDVASLPVTTQLPTTAEAPTTRALPTTIQYPLTTEPPAMTRGPTTPALPTDTEHVTAREASTTTDFPTTTELPLTTEPQTTAPIPIITTPPPPPMPISCRSVRATFSIVSGSHCRYFWFQTRVYKCPPWTLFETNQCKCTDWKSVNCNR